MNDQINKEIELYLFCYIYDNNIVDMVNELRQTKEITNLEFALILLQENKHKIMKKPFMDVK